MVVWQNAGLASGMEAYYASRLGAKVFWRYRLKAVWPFLKRRGKNALTARSGKMMAGARPVAEVTATSHGNAVENTSEY